MTRDHVARWGRAGALYDLLASIAFVTPWTGAFAMDLIGTPHTTATRMFATLFGTVVVMWSVVRWLKPERVLITADTVGRALFCCWFTWALLQGETKAIAVFLVLELFWGAAQLRALTRR